MNCNNVRSVLGLPMLVHDPNLEMVVIGEGKLGRFLIRDMPMSTVMLSAIGSLQQSIGGKAPLTHSHGIDDITGLQAELTALSQGSVHSHPISGVVGLELALENKADAAHTHTLNNVSGLVLALLSKAPAIHSHSISAINGLQTAMDGKANSIHVHGIASITGLQGELDKYAPRIHGHDIDDITGLRTELDNINSNITHPFVMDASPDW